MKYIDEVLSAPLEGLSLFFFTYRSGTRCDACTLRACRWPATPVAGGAALGRGTARGHVVNDRLNAGPSGTDRGAARLLLHAMMHGRNVVDHVASVSVLVLCLL